MRIWVVFAVLSAGLAAGQTAELEAYRRARRELAHRPRGIIFNNDGCDVLYYPKSKPVTAEGFLAERTSGLEGSAVGTIAYCTISSGFSFFTHATRAGTVLTRQGADYGILPDTRNVSQELIDSGRDCLRLVTDWAHAHGTEVFWSMRMNDTHDVEHRPDKPYLLYPPLKEQHPDWLVGEPVKRTPYGRWSSVDYGRPEVRELAFRYLDEVARGYDVDGLELDFFRHLTYFRATAMGGKASDADRAAMTELLRRVRAMTEEVGLRRGRPLLLTVRVPDSVDYCRDLGLDLETWLRDGLVDLLVTTCYFRLNPWSYSVELGHKYGVAVYPCLSDSRVTGETRFRRASLESYRGRAANAWAAGADGIHLFNLFEPKSPVFREVGSPAALRGKDKLYFVSVRDGRPDDSLAGGETYQHLPLLGPGHSATITPGRPYEVGLDVGEDLADAKAAGLTPAVTLHLELPRVTAPAQVAASLNGHALAGGTLAKGWVDLPVEPGWLVRGENRLRVALDPAAVADTGWTLGYDGQALPAAPWHRDRGSARTEAKLEAGGLRIADRGTEPGDYLYWRQDWGADREGKAVVEARVKVVSGQSCLIFSDGARHERLVLTPQGIELYSDAKRRYAMDTTGDFHTYRVEVGGADLRVYVDDQLRLDAPGSWVPRAGRWSNELAFGAANSPSVGEAIWASVRARVATQVLRDACVSVRYPPR